MRRTGVRLLVAAVGATAALSATPAIAATCPNGNACFWTKPKWLLQGYILFDTHVVPTRGSRIIPQ
jgi:hypothetical protein